MINRLKYKVIQVFKKHYLPRWLVLVIDISLVFVCFLFAYLLRFNLVLSSFSMTLALKQALLVSSVYLIFMVSFKSYAGLIRQTTVKDTFLISVTNTAALVLLFLLTLLSREFSWSQFFNVPLSILLIHFGTVTVAHFFFRISIKMFYVFVSIPTSHRKNVLIYGSGAGGIVVSRVIQSDPKSEYHLKGFIDDNEKLHGKKVDGFPVYPRDILTQDFIEAEGITTFIFAIKDISRDRKTEVLESVIRLNLEVLDTPSFDQWLNGSLKVRQLRKVQLEDLLGREPIILDLKRIGNGLRGKTILVTGAAGSIGSEIVRQLTKFSYRQLVLVDQAETPAFYLDNELKEKFPMSNYDLVIGDVTDMDRMDHIFRKYKPEIVFHAAAYKHVPMMEANPHEAFRTNVGGTKVISELAIKYATEKFVMISSDKAVNPTNVMGATKKICELLVQAQARRKGVTTQFVTTRFGNVLGSNGSVIPLFRKQISEGGPVTVTHPDITRFFMTIPEACQLVLEAGFMGNGGEIFVFDMGQQIRVADIAVKLIHLSGLIPFQDIEIKYTGLRPGEKLYEELFSDTEQQLPTHNSKISIARVSDADYEFILTRINNLLLTMYSKSDSDIVVAMRELVPGYTAYLAATS
ncbi:MAG: polysaccharide biosynthesis protein [Bacteroidales bacterium]|jgi:FlaA1/EpsC-like NDP-sugar epimerase|nr:polysaccharide biosynthesis protein [Bacteroidales bacterium]